VPITSNAVKAMVGRAIEGSADTTNPLAQIAITIPSNLPAGSSEFWDFIGMGPVFREWIGSRKPVMPIEYEYSVKNRKFEASIVVPLDWVNNDKSDLVRRRVAGLEMRYGQLRAALVATLINSGASLNGFDGVSFWNTTHNYGKTGNFSNSLTETVANRDNVTPYELALAIARALAHMQGFRDDQGEPNKEAMRSFAVICPQAHAAALNTAWGAQFLATGTGSVDNPLRGWLASLEGRMIVSPRITLNSSRSFAVVDTTEGAIAFGLQENAADSKLTAKAEGSDFEHDNDAWEFGAKWVGNAGYGAPTDAVLTTFANA